MTWPAQELRGFRRLMLQPGETRYLVEPAIIEMMVGASSAGICLRGQFTIIGEAAIIDCKVFANQVTVE